MNFLLMETGTPRQVSEREEDEEEDVISIF